MFKNPRFVRAFVCIVFVVPVCGLTVLALNQSNAQEIRDRDRRAVTDESRAQMPWSRDPESRVFRDLGPREIRDGTARRDYFRPDSGTRDHLATLDQMAKGAIPGLNEEMELAREIRQKADSYRRTRDPKEAESIKEELDKLVGAHFDLLRKRRESEIETLEKRIAAIRAMQKKREDLRDAIVDSQVSRLLGLPDPLAWNYQLPGVEQMPNHSFVEGVKDTHRHARPISSYPLSDQLGAKHPLIISHGIARTSSTAPTDEEEEEAPEREFRSTFDALEEDRPGASSEKPRPSR